MGEKEFSGSIVKRKKEKRGININISFNSHLEGIFILAGKITPTDKASKMWNTSCLFLPQDRNSQKPGAGGGTGRVRKKLLPVAEARAMSQGQAEFFHFRQERSPKSPPNVTALV